MIQNNSCTGSYQTPWKQAKLDEQDMRNTAGEVRTNSWAMFSIESLHTDEQVLDNR